MHDAYEFYLTPRQCKAYVDRRLSPELVRLGLTYSNAPFVREISKNPNISMKDLSEIMMVDKAFTTRTVTALISSGFVIDEGEGHKYSLVLTEKGREAAEVIATALSDVWKDMLKCLTEEEEHTFMMLLGKIMNTIRGS